MIFNNFDIKLCELTVNKADEITSLLNKDEPVEDGDSITYETVQLVNIEGLLFHPSYDFENTEGEMVLKSIYLVPEAKGDKVLEEIHSWKDRIVEKYDCTVWDEEYNQPDYSAEIGFEDDEDHWMLRISTNSFNFDHDIRFDIE